MGALTRASARRPWVIIGIWGLLFLAGGLFAGDGEVGFESDALDVLDPATTTENRFGGTVESARAERLLEDKLRGPAPIVEVVIVQSDTLTVEDQEFRAKVEAVYADIAALGSDVATPGTNYYLGDPPEADLVSADGRTTIFRVAMSGGFQQATQNVERVLEVVEKADGRDGFRVLAVGEASIALEQTELAERDLRQGERVGVPIALFILVVLFGTLVAVIMPIGLSLIAITLALGIAALVGQAFQLSSFVALMIIMIGLAVGIDYSMIIISRFRDEMRRGLDKYEAIEVASATAGRTVLFSGVTVIIALSGMLIVPMTFLQSLGLGAILVVLVALAATLTFLPAILAIVGNRMERFAVPYFGTRAARRSDSAEEPEAGFWDRTTRWVMRYPVVSIIAIGAPMVVVILFYFLWPGINTGINSVSAFPEGAETREAFLVMEEEFSFGQVTPTDIVISGDADAPDVQEAIGELQATLVSLQGVEVSPALNVNDAGDLAHITLFIAGAPGRPETAAVVTEIRDQHIRSAFEGVDAEVLVGGVVAEVADLLEIADTYTPIVFAFVLGTSFLLLLLVFRSIVIPIKAVVMNLLSVGTAYGLIVLVFQKGIGAELLGFQQVDIIEAWLPLFLFSVLFGLSMDYHVFLLSSIRERYDQTGDNLEAVAYGLRSTAAMITGAALIMVAVFGAFASGDTTINQQMGFGLAVAVLLDATLVRMVLVPASMELLGKGNWYLPSWLGWLPNLRVEGELD